ncbi:MAG: hypothetical protein KF805_07395 [Phycisphaeraceae bacterium]|nr:hypothetical protein [Phycisphaeraceae bacterium]
MFKAIRWAIRMKQLWCGSMFGMSTLAAHFTAAQPLNLCDYEWKHVTASAAASEPAGAWNPDTGRFMVYGGLLSGWSPETWEFDGHKWIRLDAKTPRQLASRSNEEFYPRASMAYDEHRQKMCLALVYPRMNDRASDAELYEWDGSTWKFKSVLPIDFRLNTQDYRIHLVYDPAAKKLLVLNGKSNQYMSLPFAATGWHFDGNAFTPIGFAPAANWTLHHQVAADPVRERILFSGAFPNVSGYLCESFAGAIVPASPFPLSPSAAFPALPFSSDYSAWGMCSYYSPVHRGIVQAGGVRGAWPSGASNVLVRIRACNTATAVWDGATWRMISSDSPRVGGGVACFDPLVERGLLFGGRSFLGENTTGSGDGSSTTYTNARVGDVWALQDDSWQLLTSPPLGMTGHSGATILDRTTGRLIVANSARNTESDVNAYFQAEWNGLTWKRGPTSLGGSYPYPALPSPSPDVQFAWDPSSNKAIAVASMENPAFDLRVRTFRLEGTEWVQIGAENRDWRWWRIVTNAAAGKVWLICNSGNSGVFELGGSDGATWVKVSTQAPAGTSALEMYYDDQRNCVVSLELWPDGRVRWLQEFDGTTWKGVVQSLPFFFGVDRGSARAWNPLLRAIVAVNYAIGRNASQTIDLTPLGFPTNADHRLAIWNGTTWQIINDGGAHPADAGYIWQDQQSGKWFSYGGTPRSDIWELVPITGDRFVRQPSDAIGYAGRNISTSFEFRGGVGAVSYSWRVNGVPITASPTVNGNTISGWSKPTISITGMKAGTNATLDCVITTGCETYITQPVRLFATCLGDLNGDSMVDDADFVIFVSCYDNYYTPDDKPLCRLDNSSQVTDDKDFLVFVAAYEAGVCPP